MFVTIPEEKTFKSDLDFLTKVLDLPEFKVVWYELDEERKELKLVCEHRHSYGICSICKQVSNSHHQSVWRQVRDLPAFGYKVFVLFLGRRFNCEHCESPFTELLQSIGFRRRHTKRFEQDVYQRAQEKSISATMREVQLGYTATAGAFYRQARLAQERTPRETFRVLGIDEIALKKGHKDFILILSDLERHIVLDVLPDRKKATLENWIDELSEKERKCILVVSIDMWRPYALAIKGRLPSAALVADRFHVTKNLHKALDRARRDIQRHLDKDIQQQVKGCRWPLLKPREKLSVKQETKLMQVYNACPALRTFHLLKEEFHLIFDKIHDSKQAERFLLAWRTKAEQSGSKHLIKFANTLRNWWTEILNYFKERVTNGFVEGINNRIKLIKRRGYGYLNIENFKMRVLSECGRSPTLGAHYL